MTLGVITSRPQVTQQAYDAAAADIDYLTRNRISEAPRQLPTLTPKPTATGNYPQLPIVAKKNWGAGCDD